MTACPVFVAMMPATCVLQTPLLVQLLLLPLWWGPWVNGLQLGNVCQTSLIFGCPVAMSFNFNVLQKHPIQWEVPSFGRQIQPTHAPFQAPATMWVIFYVALKSRGSRVCCMIGQQLVWCFWSSFFSSCCWVAIDPFFGFLSTHSFFLVTPFIPWDFFRDKWMTFCSFPQWGPLSPTKKPSRTKTCIRNFPFSSNASFWRCFFSSSSSSWGVVAWLVVIVTSVVAFLSLVQSVGSLQTWHHHNRNWLVLWWVKEKEQTLSEAKKSPSFPKKRFGKVRLGTHQTGTCFYPDLLPRNLTQLLKKWWLEDVKFQGCKWSLESWIQVHLLSCFPTSIFLLVKPVFSKALCIYCPRIMMKVPTPKKNRWFRELLRH